MGINYVTQQGLTVAQVVRATFSSTDWLTMIAIGDAESNFEPNLVNNLSGATGIWQIEPGVWAGYIQATYGVSGYTAIQQWLMNVENNARIALHILQTQGLSAWAGDGYPAYLGLAQTLLNKTAPASAAAVITAQTFSVSGSAHVTTGGRIVGSVQLHGSGGAIPYRVTMAVSPSYGSSDPTSTTATGTVPANQTITVTQSLIAPLPSPEILRSEQQRQPGPVTFPYDVSWVIEDTRTGATKTIAGGSRLALTVY